MHTGFRTSSAVAVLALSMAVPTAFVQGQVTLDFDNNGTLGDFTFFGFASTEWTVEANPLVDDSLALRTNSNGEQLDPWFSRVAILNADIFDGGQRGGCGGRDLG